MTHTETSRIENALDRPYTWAELSWITGVPVYDLRQLCNGDRRFATRVVEVTVEAEDGVEVFDLM